MIENAYLLYANYGIKETDTQTDMITKATEKSFKDFCRRVSYQQKVPIYRRTCSTQVLLQLELEKGLEPSTYALRERRSTV